MVCRGWLAPDTSRRAAVDAERAGRGRGLSGGLLRRRPSCVCWHADEHRPTDGLGAKHRPQPFGLRVPRHGGSVPAAAAGGDAREWHAADPSGCRLGCAAAAAPAAADGWAVRTASVRTTTAASVPSGLGAAAGSVAATMGAAAVLSRMRTERLHGTQETTSPRGPNSHSHSPAHTVSRFACDPAAFLPLLLMGP